jgi:DNA uptake protein ComE-like DNA-binding protein
VTRRDGKSLRDAERGSVLIIVIWVCLGLVALTLYFANSMSSELRAADNRVGELEAQQAVAAGTRYAGYVLKQFAAGGAVPRTEEYRCDAMPVGEATFWFVGREHSQTVGREPVFGLVDEASKLNLNTASRAMLELLPGMTPELAEAIFNWRRRATEDGASDGGSTYSSLTPPRLNKSAPFESVDELRLVYGMTLDVLFGEDANRNGALDANEDDGEQSAPRDDQNGTLLAGIADYVTVHSRQPATNSTGTRRVNITNAQTREAALRRLLNNKLEPGRANAVTARIEGRNFRSVAEFMIESGLSPDEYAAIRTDVSQSDRAITGLVNVNTASEAVLACIPGIGPEQAATLVAYRAAHPDALTSMAWLPEVLAPGDIIRAGPFITDQSYQFSADVAAVGANGRGYARARTVFDMSNGTPRIVYHQDLTAYGWALGADAREELRTRRERGT